MKISIVTPSFNQGKYLENAIQSVLKQNYDNFEHIIIDNCSTDNTIDIINKYNHIQFICEQDEGQADALNKGFRLASGDLIGWLNADDLYEDEVFKKVVKEFDTNNIDAIYSNCYFVDENLNIFKELRTHKPIKFMALLHCYIPSTTFFFRRKIIDEGTNIDKSIHISMDKDFFARILYKNYKVQYQNDFFAKFRWHDNNKSIDTPKIRKLRSKEGLYILNKCLKKQYTFSKVNIMIYTLLARIMLVYRKYLKFIA